MATSDFLAVEDACQVLGRWPGDKYIISTEEAITGLAQCCRAPGVAALELYRLLVFAYLSGKGDLHAKNLAVLHDARGEWRVTPGYDLPSSAIYGDRTMALPLGGVIRQQLSWPMLRSLGEEIGIRERLLQRSSANKHLPPGHGSKNWASCASMPTQSGIFGVW